MNHIDLLPLLIVAHLVGDFLLQNNWMAANKARSHVACACHVSSYSLPFLALVLFAGVPLAALILVAAQHYLQDRYALHLRWMKFYGQTPPERWPVGPLCVDQAMHLAWIALVLLVL